MTVHLRQRRRLVTALVGASLALSLVGCSSASVGSASSSAAPSG